MFTHCSSSILIQYTSLLVNIIINTCALNYIFFNLSRIRHIRFIIRIEWVNSRYHSLIWILSTKVFWSFLIISQWRNVIIWRPLLRGSHRVQVHGILWCFHLLLLLLQGLLYNLLALLGQYIRLLRYTNRIGCLIFLQLRALLHLLELLLLLLHLLLVLLHLLLHYHTYHLMLLRGV